MSVRILAVSLLAASVASAQPAPPARVLDLLKLPEVFGSGPCDPFEPTAILPVAKRIRGDKEEGARVTIAFAFEDD